jgi:glycosyltransferase involved in cell wall biosynthesis
MNLLYLSLAYVPSRRAASVHVMSMCSALGRAGHAVELVAKRMDEPSAAGLDDFAFYGVPPTFTLTKLARPPRRGGGLVFAGLMARHLARRRKTVDLVYSRDLLGTLAAATLGMPFVFEAHGIPTQPSYRAILRRVLASRSLRGLVSISDALRRDLADEGFHVPATATVIAPDAANPPAREPAPPNGLHGTRPRVGYVGNLYEGRGVELIIELAARLPHCDVEIVGGRESDLARWRAKDLPSNLTLAGFVPPSQLGERYASFDVLLMPYASTNVRAASGSDISRWISPMKLFEYMAAKRPMVSSDLPVLREVLVDGENALIAPSDDIPAWQRAVQRLIEDRPLAARIATTAYQQLVREHTWDARVQRILGGLSLS